MNLPSSFRRFGGGSVILLAGILMAPLGAEARTLRVTIENLAPSGGNFLTPLWVGFQNGSFDTYDIGAPILQPGLESLAEDGETAAISNDFANSGASVGNQRATITGPGGAFDGPIDPGEKVTPNIDVDAANRYFSYAAMVIPSNDFFIANGDPLAYQVFDDAGAFTPVAFSVFGDGVRDAGTEVNDELPANTAFFGQAAPNTGVDENGTVQVAGGFIPGGAILDAFPGADYTQPDYEVARISVAPIPLPAPLVLLLGGIAGLGTLGFRRRA